jgi:hypothetical protein
VCQSDPRTVCDGKAAGTVKTVPILCRGCSRPLEAQNLNIADCCPCNSPRGINHGLVPTEACTCNVCDPEQTGSTRWYRLFLREAP